MTVAMKHVNSLGTKVVRERMASFAVFFFSYFFFLFFLPFAFCLIKGSHSRFNRADNTFQENGGSGQRGGRGKSGGRRRGRWGRMGVEVQAWRDASIPRHATLNLKTN